MHAKIRKLIPNIGSPNLAHIHTSSLSRGLLSTVIQALAKPYKPLLYTSKNLLFLSSKRKKTEPPLYSVAIPG
jgi:hypothetical protein